MRNNTDFKYYLEDLFYLNFRPRIHLNKGIHIMFKVWKYYVELRLLINNLHYLWFLKE